MGVNGWKELLKKYIGSLCLTGLEIKKKIKLHFWDQLRKVSHRVSKFGQKKVS